MSEEKIPPWLWIVGGIATVVILYASGRLFRAVAEGIHSHSPPDDAKNEIEHRKALAAHLRSVLAETSMIEEYGNERSRVDIVIGNSPKGVECSDEKLAVELKFRLKDKSEIDRLIGQCVGYKQFGYKRAIVVLVDTDPNMVEVLKNRASAQPLAGFMALIEARKKSPATTSHEPLPPPSNCAPPGSTPIPV